MRIFQRGISAVFCTIFLSLLVLMAGMRGGYAVTTMQETDSSLLLPIDIERYIAREEAFLFADPEQEDKQIEEAKQYARHHTNRLSEHAKSLLASRSLALEKYAQSEKIRLGRKVAESALRYLGTPYTWGGTNPHGFDCSGFTQYVYLQNGVRVPRNSYDQYEVGKPVQRTELQPGDLVFFTTYAPGPSHLGIYIGEGKFIHALNQHTGVTTSVLDNDYYKSRYLGAKRVL